MIRASLVIGTALALCATASAQDCPPGAATQATIPNGTAFRAISLHPDDAYYDSSYAEIVGMNGTTTGELTNNGGCWYGGPANSDSGDSYYFYKVALVVDAAEGGKTGITPPNSTACPSDAIRSAPTVGTSYTVLGIHPDDAYFGSPTVSVGETVVFGEDTTVRNGCWISGGALTTSGADLYFFKVAVSASPGGSRLIASCPRTAATGTLAGGTRVRFLGVRSDDAYANGAGSFAIGDMMTITETVSTTDGCWFGGSATAADGSSPYFYKAAFEVVGGGGKGAIGASGVADQLRRLPPNDALDAAARRILVANFDTNGSGTIDTMNEVNRIPCDVLTALDVPYQARWGTSVRVALGFKSNLSWVGGSIGFDGTMRSIADRQFERCGVR